MRHREQCKPKFQFKFCKPMCHQRLFQKFTLKAIKKHNSMKKIEKSYYAKAIKYNLNFSFQWNDWSHDFKHFDYKYIHPKSLFDALLIEFESAIRHQHFTVERSCSILGTYQSVSQAPLIHFPEEMNLWRSRRNIMAHVHCGQFFEHWSSTSRERKRERQMIIISTI